MPRASSRFDLLHVPLLGAFLRWRYSRFALQLPLLLIAALCVYDGLTGRQLAPRNTATVAVWVHYRGLVALALALAGNLFCAACPLMLTRGQTKFLKRFLPQLELPRFLRNKYGVLGLTLLFLFSYEYFDLWASPWLTAWLILAYFAAALLTDAIFPAGTFCKYACPLGNFNFALSVASPTQIKAIDQGVCQSCEGKYCLNGRVETMTTRAPLHGVKITKMLLELPMVRAAATRGAFPGCETDLFVPAIQSNTDCTLCLNCVRACPYDNVALALRSPLQEAITLRPRADWAWFITVLTWAGLVNAFAMIPAFFAVAAWLSNLLSTRDEALLLLIIQGVGIGTGALLTWTAARGKLRDWVGVLFPLTLAVWGGHYLFHFVTGYNTLLPNALFALERLGLEVTALALPGVVRGDGIFWIQAAISYAALLASGWSAYRKAARGEGDARAVLLEMLPMLLLIVLFNTLTLLIFSQPMQARGSLLP